MRYFLNRIMYSNNTIVYKLFNPSIGDFIINRTNNSNRIINIFKNLKTEESIHTLYNLTRKNLLSKEVLHKIVNNLTNSELENNIIYSIELINISFEHEIKIEINILTCFVNYFINEKKHFDYFEDNIDIFVKSLYILKNSKVDINYINTIEYLLENHKINEKDEINSLLKFIHTFNLLNDKILNKLAFDIGDYLVDELNRYNFQFDNLLYEYNLDYLKNNEDFLIKEIKNYYIRLYEEELNNINLIPKLECNYFDYVIDHLDINSIYQSALEDEEFDQNELID